MKTRRFYFSPLSSDDYLTGRIDPKVRDIHLVNRDNKLEHLYQARFEEIAVTMQHDPGVTKSYKLLEAKRIEDIGAALSVDDNEKA